MGIWHLLNRLHQEVCTAPYHHHRISAISGDQDSSEDSKTLDEILKAEVNRPHRNSTSGEFLLNLSYECSKNFGEHYQRYLNEHSHDSNEKVRQFITYYQTLI